ncbi:Peptidoglycan-binding lysin domain-containing protein [Cynara cardunculus var. scolymus]|uniref:Peptidoglycan-binding lysin domain-containing protein n=1 Tax=Cynara cardunculus var. scolymus TaxID=59895 RepID=A0A103XTI0_CYNCS|nr:Peptidoglycan-binding lysin domain-containing protein [Cynara cardunculus var. scolymus]
MAYNKASMLLSCILLLSFALLISVGESKVSFHKSLKRQPVLVCNKIYGTQAGDTCFSIIQAFHLTTTAFSTINPNLNCDKVFVGEWLCVNGFSI